MAEPALPQPFTSPTAAGRQVGTPGQWQPTLPTPLTSFIGRQREIARATEIMRRRDVRLVTLHGPGGVGKTRLAIRVANDLVDDFPGGIWFVALAAIRDPTLVASAIAQTLGIQDTGARTLDEGIQAFLGNRRALLILDNFEHVLEAGPLIVSLLTDCPALTVLVTSRAVPRLSGDHDVAIPPLQAPDARARRILPELAETESVQLFIERARAARDDFALTDGNADVIAELCRRLDGLPLAIELAAPWLRVLPPEALLARLQQRLPLLTGGPHDQPTRLRAMRDAIGWSYDLLSPDEQSLFRRLAVFIGGCTLEAAKAVAAGPGDLAIEPIAGIASLVDKSLLRQETGADGQPRFSMLETIREYGLEQLTDCNELEVVRSHHLEHWVAFAEHVAAPLYTNPLPLLRRVTSERDNLRAAMSWARERADGTALIRVAASLGPYWHLSGQLREGGMWMEQALAFAPDAPAPLRATLFREAGEVFRFQGDYERAGVLGRESEALFRAHGDASALAQAIVLLGHVAEDRGDYAQSLALHQEALDLLLPRSERFWTAIVLRHVGWLSFLCGNVAAAERHLEAALTRFRHEANPFGTAIALSALGEVAFQRGDYARAAALKHERLSNAWDEWSLRDLLDSLAKIASASGEHERAARLLGAAEAFRERLGIALVPGLAHQAERTAEAMRAALGESAFAAAWEEGRRMSPEEARVEASRVGHEASIPEAPAATHGLTPRELEVLRLVAQGRSNREIATALYISVPTVKRHTSNILGKLELSSRAAVAAYAHAHGLL